MPYQCVRTYRFQPGSLGLIQDAVMQELVPAFERQPGFQGYRLITTADDRAVSESLWETYAQAESADVVEATWVRRSISSWLAGLPDLFVGPVVVSVEG